MKNESLGQRFARIREHYKTELPRMMAVYEETGRCHFDPYRLDFTTDMTPIEYSVWCDIRGTCLPFYPLSPARQLSTWATPAEEPRHSAPSHCDTSSSHSSSDYDSSSHSHSSHDHGCSSSSYDSSSSSSYDSGSSSSSSDW